METTTLFGWTADQWNAAGTIAAAVAAVVVAWFGWIQLHRQASESKLREEMASARLSAAAYMLRRRLLSWLEFRSQSLQPERFAEWVEAGRRGDVFDIGAEMTRALGESHDMMSLLPDVPKRASAYASNRSRTV